VTQDKILGDLEELVARAREGDIQRVYLAFPLSATERTRYLIQRLADTTASVYLVPDFYTYNLVNSRMIHLGSLTAISVFELPYAETDWYVKRAFDATVVEQMDAPGIGLDRGVGGFALADRARQDSVAVVRVHIAGDRVP